MGRWTLEMRGSQQVLTHDCERARRSDTSEVLSQDIGGGYVRCSRCGEKFLPTDAPGSPRLLLRLHMVEYAMEGGPILQG
jgi:hypothetical protein